MSRGGLSRLSSRGEPGERDQIWGCKSLGIDRGEVLSMIQIPMLGKVPSTALRDGDFAHPLLEESWTKPLGQLEDRSSFYEAERYGDWVGWDLSRLTLFRCSTMRLVLLSN